MHRRLLAVGLGGVLAATAAAAARAAEPSPDPSVSAVSVTPDGHTGKGGAIHGSASDDGRYVAFYSPATDLVPGDANDNTDVFLRDRQTGKTTLVSVAADGTQGNGYSYEPSISGDGRYIVYSTDASNLVPGDDNGRADVLVYDRETGTTTLVSAGPDLTSGDGSSDMPVISADGRRIAFRSNASDLGPQVGARPSSQVYVYDLADRRLALVSHDDDGNPANKSTLDLDVSSDGRYITYTSGATNLAGGRPDEVLNRDLYLYDRQDDSTTRLITSAYSSSMSADGRFVAFNSYGTGILPASLKNVGIFLLDRTTGNTTLVSAGHDGTEPDKSSFNAVVSADGRYVSYRSNARNLVPGGSGWMSGVYLYDRQNGTTTRVAGGTDSSYAVSPAFSRDGTHLKFASSDPNLVPGDTNNAPDIFIRRLG
ncbi:TolB family protein [Actinoplanes sp. NPDC049668]|uniref:TolB family protein n=1 Tax=unclassified Actinoplanes TaxID=2626549 RepID=UPI0033B557F0